MAAVTKLDSTAHRFIVFQFHHILLLFLFIFRPSVSNPEGKILKTKQVRPQQRLLGGESVVEGGSPTGSGRRPHFPVGERPTAVGTGMLFPWCLQ